MTNNLKPFDLDRALAGDKVVTRDGQKIIDLFLSKNPELDEYSKLVGTIEDDDDIYTWGENSIFCIDDEDDSMDFFMVPNTKKLWIAIGKKESKFCHITSAAYLNKEDAYSQWNIDEYIIKEIEIEV